VFRQAVSEVRQRLGSKATICFVGDTPDDVQAARKVGGQIIAVCTGIFKSEDLQSHAPDACVADCSELLVR
jgi:phosphoglycolate phosphatase-like HAD superfamily hydrolase